MLKAIALSILMTAAVTRENPAPGFQLEGDISDEMIPEGWEYVTSATGDVNNDGRADLIIVATPGNKLVTAVYLDNGNDKWMLHKQYDNAFRDVSQMSFTPEYNITIEDGLMKVELFDPDQFTMEVASSYTFRCHDANMELVEEIHDGTQKELKNAGLKFGEFQIY